MNMIRDRTPAEPTATEAAAYVGIRIAEYGAYIIIMLVPIVGWIVTR